MTIADRVRVIIGESGRSQRDIAEQVGIDAPKLTKSLKGDRRFSSYELAALAEIGGRTVEWILSGVEPRRLTFAHRASLLDREIADNAGREAASMIADRFETAQDLGFAPDVPALPSARVTSGYVETANRFAAAAISRVTAPIRDLDTRELVHAIEEKFGVNVAIEELPDGVDGLSFADGTLRIIVVASTDRSGRQRFTLAHELGHILFGDGGDEVIEEQLFARSTGNQEPRANSFAAVFLMPADEVEQVLQERDPTEVFDELVWTFRVSPDAMAWRLHNLGKVGKDAAKRLGATTLHAIAVALGRVEEHAARMHESSVLRPAARLTGAYIGAFLAGEVAAAPVAEVSGLTIDTVYRIRDEMELPIEWPDLFDEG